ncbi:2-succinyl-5-enolpyruvyl-6-hydroxy-3-cyclohexene-1-carboxylic-acid synthase [Thiocystis violacea]|uniref:2-succinyl-5-enolpyruvyl-6-hydroxy-3- cyclohexene-1-carboxylic-acid synthase n=1 Tax=Thiocystis violacea TaxID=13725 RepID=UPI001908FC3C|nr:2-succinyl-5-enolpyruvyl-6-hydroxy-3-cyclohexene-1-carboxylic-acid synthase [Thiocystis violacea]MBK1716283.1 2-succinyl-5-enolpyruvyl-6-hydroxy-3-cyclohexene-1-carboxylic-acid synthase [Thiocystis violacea]
MDQACLNLRWSLALFDGLLAGGMRHLVLSPGSRSTPLVLAAQRQPALELTTILDERSAGFFALGIARASGRPVGLLCTSGSALAHWFPAVIEASESEIPLILLSADRPPELRGWGANQTIDQIRLFGGFAREFHDPGTPEDAPAAFKMMRALGARATAVSLGPWPGPVHLNLPFREPLVPGPDCLTETPAQDFGRSPGHSFQGERDWEGDAWPELPSPFLAPRGLIVCGPGRYPSALVKALWDGATRLDLPLLCDPLSGLRFGPAPEHRVTRYDSLLRNPRAAASLKPDWVLRLGRSPVSKTLNAWLADVPTLAVDPGQGWSDPNHDVHLRVGASPVRFLRWLAARNPDRAGRDPDWLPRWIRAERHLDRRAADHLDQSPWCEGHLIRDLLDALPAGDGLLCANSLPIRQLDTWSGSRAAGLSVFGNRGASGIDGQTSTLAGLNAGGTPTTGLLGDLSFLHDLSGLLLTPRLDRPCIVLNNGGGRIFDYLPQHGLPGFEQLWRTPLPIDLADLTRTFGLVHRKVSDGAGFKAALAEALDTERCLIEARLDADLSREVHQAFWRAIRDDPFGAS